MVGDGGLAAPPLVTTSIATNEAPNVDTATADVTIAADVRQVDCPDHLTDRGVACGIATVPRDRDDAQFGIAEISFVTMAGDGLVATPLAVLQGGPGGASTDLARWFPPRLFPQVFIDQRGTGFAATDFDCLEFDASLIGVIGAEATEAAAIAERSLSECAARLADDPLLDHTTTANHANDVEAVMVGLGYTQWIAYGVSYGSTIGFELLAADRDGLTGVVLDGVYPPGLDIEAGYVFSAQRSLDALTEACSESAQCAGYNANVGASVERLLDRFESSPLTVTVDNTDVVLDDVHLAEYVFLLSYSEQQMRYLPAVLTGIEENDEQALRWFARTATSTLTSASGANDEGTYYAVTCHDRLPFVAELSDGLSTYQAALVSSSLAERCPPWSQGATTATGSESVRSDLPALLLSGQFDPITPSVFAEDAASGFSMATRVTQNGRGHGIWSGNECIGRIVDAFVTDPGRDLDTSCAEFGVPVLWAQP
jgi:pimeloyl-ACP methyl ester carboxylesterase